MLISFSGTDGAGKSTQIKLLRAFIGEEKTNYFWGRGGYTPGILWLKKYILILLGRTPQDDLYEKSSSRDYERRRDVLLSNKIVARLWLYLATLDMFIFYAVILRLQQLRGKIIICDRYICDTELDFELKFGPLFSDKSWYWCILKNTVPQPELRLLLLVPPGVSEQRSKLKGEPFPDDESVLKARYKRYSSYSSREFYSIDGCDSVNNIQEKIRSAYEALRSK